MQKESNSSQNTGFFRSQKKSGSDILSNAIKIFEDASSEVEKAKQSLQQEIDKVDVEIEKLTLDKEVKSGNLDRANRLAEKLFNFLN